MKKNEKEAIKPKPKPQEIKFKIEAGRIVFDMGDREYFMGQEQAGFLFGENVVNRFKQLWRDELEDFSDFNTSDFIAKFAVADEFYESLQDVAKYLKVDEQKLRRWMSDTESRKLHNKLSIYDGKHQHQAAYKKYRLELFGDETAEIEYYNPDMKAIRKIADLVLKKDGPKEIAKKMKVEYGAFLKWFTSKEPQDKIQNYMRNKGY